MLVTVEQVENAILTTLNVDNPYFPFEFEDASQINEGSCENFAMAVCAYLKHPENLEIACADADTPHFCGHVWLTLRLENETLYFDSEAPEGTDTIDSLPFFQRN